MKRIIYLLPDNIQFNLNWNSSQSLSDHEFNIGDGTDEFYNAYGETFLAMGHRLSGYPYFTQSDPRGDKKNVQDYILLFQLDTDDAENDIMWGDSGVGNFFIHPEDLKKRDFSKVLYNWDCC